MSMNEDPNQQGAGQEAQPGESLSDLRAAADKGRRLERENVMLKAGVDVSTPLGAMFASTGYTGDLEVGSVKEAWAALAPATPATAETPEAAPVLSREAEAHQAQAQQDEDRIRRGISSQPADPGHTPEIDPLKAAYEQRDKNLANGVSQDKAGKPVIEAILMGAVNGDERFVFNGWTDEELREGRVSRA